MLRNDCVRLHILKCSAVRHGGEAASVAVLIMIVVYFDQQMGACTMFTEQNHVKK